MNSFSIKGVQILLIGASFMIQSTNVFAQNTTSVVQINGYEVVKGVYPELQGFGSASIISDDGLLLTNSHVIEKQSGSKQDEFSICISSHEGEIPACDFTAYLIASDPERDIALLRLDTNDIYGNTNNFSQLPVLQIDETYIPTTNDTVTAVGYPQIGAETQTQTSGIVSGTQERNGATYIKSDALISGGNSGGPLLKDGKIIGLNTFTSGGYGSSLSYALSSKDIFDFVSLHTESDDLSNDLERPFKENFVQYMKKIRSAQQSGTITDDIFSVSIPVKYKLIGYQENASLLYISPLPDRGDISHISIQRSENVPIGTHEEFLYVLQKDGIFEPTYQSLQEIQISDRQFYQIVSKNDPNKGQSDQLKTYVGKSATNGYISIYLLGDSELDTTLFEKNQENVKNILEGITIHETGTISKKTQDFFDPMVSFSTGRWSGKPSLPIYSLFGNNHPDRIMYLNSLYEDISIHIREQTREDGKGASIEEIFEAETQDLDTNEKWLITVDGYEGFLYCLNNTESRLTPQGDQKSVGVCNTTISLPGVKTNESYFIDIILHADMQRFDTYKMVYGIFLQDYFNLHSDGETNILQYLQKIETPFKDISNQLQGYEKKLHRLLEYDLIKEKNVFGGDEGVTRNDFLSHYVRFIYPNEDEKFITKIMNVSQDILGVQLDQYVREDTIDTFHKTIQAYLGGVPINQLDTQTIHDIFTHRETLYTDMYNTILDREYDIYGKRKVSLSEAIEVVPFKQGNQLRYEPSVGLQAFELFTSGVPLFDGSALRVEREEIREQMCNTSTCDKELFKPFMVLSYGSMIDTLSEWMDASFFDRSLERKKQENGNFFGFNDFNF